MFTYFRKAILKKRARRTTMEYPGYTEDFILEGIGNVRFANWQNPLIRRKELSSQHLHFFSRFIKPGDLAIDIGANIGQMTVPMALAAGTQGLTLAFDPNPFVFKILEINAGLNKDHSNIQAFNYAITSKEASFYYHSSEASFGNGGISETPESRHGRFSLSQKIRGIRLEEFLDAQFPGFAARLKLIKIDTEGYDLEIIKSVSGLIQNHRPYLIAECFTRLTPSERAELFQQVRALGYRLYHFTDFTRDTVFTPLQHPGDMLRWKHFDFIAEPEHLKEINS